MKTSISLLTVWTLLLFSSSLFAEPAVKGKQMDPETMRALEAQIERQMKILESTPRSKPMLPERRAAMKAYGVGAKNKISSIANEYMLSNKTSAEGLIDVFIEQDGKLHHVDLLRASGNQELNEIVHSAVTVGAPYEHFNKVILGEQIFRNKQVLNFTWKFVYKSTEKTNSITFQEWDGR